MCQYSTVARIGVSQSSIEPKTQNWYGSVDASKKIFFGSGSCFLVLFTVISQGSHLR